MCVGVCDVKMYGPLTYAEVIKGLPPPQKKLISLSKEQTVR